MRHTPFFIALLTGMTIMPPTMGCGDSEELKVNPRGSIQDETGDDTKDDPKDDPMEDPMDNPIEDPKNDPMDDPKDDPKDDPMEDPKDDPITDADAPNKGWIGGACQSKAQCTFDDAICLSAADGFTDGTCSQACDKFCPDRDGNNSVTFCVATDNGGRCLSRCDFELYEGQGCRQGYLCQVEERQNDPGTKVASCVPESWRDASPQSMCLAGITQNGVIWSSWDYTTRSPDGDSSLRCTIDEPIRVTSPINGVTYKYYNKTTSSPMSMGCELADALHKLGNVLKRYDITEVLHIGTFNCRKISGSSNLSQHSHGRAIDIYGFIDSKGERYILEDHWEHDKTSNFTTDKARILYEIGQAMHTERIFNIVLTPNYNAGHDNHFHVDLKPGSNYIGLTQPEYYFGHDRWNEFCPGH